MKEQIQCDFCRKWFDMDEILILEYEINVRAEDETDEDTKMINELIKSLRKDYMESDGPKDCLLPWMQEFTFSCRKCSDSAKEKCNKKI